MNYQIACYHGVDLYKWKHDISRSGLEQYSVGKNGFDKTLTLEQVIRDIAIPSGANLIIKGGKNAKWYVKKVAPEDIDETMRSRSTNYALGKHHVSYRLTW